jgi:hypothetical protein
MLTCLKNPVATNESCLVSKRTGIYIILLSVILQGKRTAGG